MPLCRASHVTLNAAALRRRLGSTDASLHQQQQASLVPMLLLKTTALRGTRSAVAAPLAKIRKGRAQQLHAHSSWIALLLREGRLRVALEPQ